MPVGPRKVLLSPIGKPIEGFPDPPPGDAPSNLESFGIHLLTANPQTTITPTCLGDPPVDHDRLNAHPGYKAIRVKEKHHLSEL
ncbi:hypothetical protein TNCV_4116201 [Trichonephila clavipes]|nr:hypothetical protein TNCV_4116201 [Trichonephila clavipes]